MMNVGKSTLYMAGAALIGASSASAAQAQDPNDGSDAAPAQRFGNAGQIAFSSENSFDIRHSSDDLTTIRIAPAADYFIIKDLSIGGFIGFDYSKAGRGSGTRFSIGPRVGYNLAFTDSFGLWPKLGLSFAHSSSGFTTAVGDTDVTRSTDNNAIALNLFAPFMFHPARHFFAGIGPFLDTDLSGDNRVTAYGIKLAVGGWLGM